MNAIRLRMEGIPQDHCETAALVIHAALKFCAKPETFHVFQLSALADDADTDWVVAVLDHLKPAHLTEIAQMIAGGMVAELEETMT